MAVHKVAIQLLDRSENEVSSVFLVEAPSAEEAVIQVFDKARDSGAFVGRTIAQKHYGCRVTGGIAECIPFHSIRSIYVRND